MNRALITLIVIGAVATAVAWGAARGPDPDAVPEPSSLNSRIMSPFCEGLSLEECPSSKAAALRADLASKARTGWTNRRIDEWIVANYGREALGRPPRAELWAVLAAAAAFIAAALAKMWTRRPSPPSVAATEPARPAPHMLERIHREVAELRGSE